ncbi:hypothetical protein GCM10029992_59490 [Glycomyces albus]
MFVYIWATPGTPEPALGRENDHESRQMTRTLGRGGVTFGTAAPAAATAVAHFVPLDQNTGARIEDPADAAPAQERGAVDSDSDAAAHGGDGSHAIEVGAEARRPAPRGGNPYQ